MISDQDIPMNPAWFRYNLKTKQLQTTSSKVRTGLTFVWHRFIFIRRGIGNAKVQIKIELHTKKPKKGATF